MHITRIPVAALALAFSLAAPAPDALAQTRPERGTATKTQTPPERGAQSPKPTATPIELATDPFKIDSIGLSLQVPVGAVTRLDTIGSQATGTVTPKDGTWILTVMNPSLANRTMSLDDLAKLQLKLLTETSGAKELDRDDNLKVDTRDARRIYVDVPSPKGSGSVVYGVTALQLGAGQFVVFQLVTPRAEFERARPVYETLVAGATFVDVRDLELSRKVVIEAGLRLLSKVEPSDFREILTNYPERWERLYVPAASGADADAKEIGYRRTRAWIGKRGELDPKRTKSQFSGTEAQEGYLVRIDARVIKAPAVVSNTGKPGEETIADTQGLFFLTPDRATEVWTIAVRLREGGKDTLYTETGGRDGTNLGVQMVTDGAPPRDLKPMIQGEGYISRLESFLIPELLLRSKAQTEFGFYNWNSDARKIVLRRDALSRPKDHPELWQITTRLKEDELPQIAFYTEQGRLIRVQQRDGSVWEPIEPAKLKRLWENKKLPMQ
jgi:hypothetical protein